MAEDATKSETLVAAIPPTADDAQLQAETPSSVTPSETAGSPAATSLEPVVEKPLNFLGDFDQKKASEDAERAAKALEETKAKEPPEEKKAEVVEKPAETAEKTATEVEKLAEPEETEKPATEVEEPAEIEPFSLDALVIPSDFKAEFDRGKEYLDTFEQLVTKSDGTPNKRAQGLIDLHAEAMRQYGQQLREEQAKTWRDTQQTWANDTMADDTIGGSNFDRAMGVIARVRDYGLRTEEERQGFNEWLNWTGSGVNRWVLRLLYNLGERIDEPQATSMPSLIKPPPDNGARPNVRKSAVLYDNERSSR